MKNILILSALFFSILIFYGCDKATTEPSGNKYNVTGSVLNTTANAVKSASVTLTKSGQTTADFSTTTNNSGAYTFDNVTEGDYILKITKSGYTNFESAVQIKAQVNRTDTLYGTATIQGQILNSQTGQGLNGATVSFTFGTDTSFTNSDLTVNTNTTGNYLINQAPTGTFTCVVRATGFFTQVISNISITNGSNTIDPTTIVGTVTGGNFRIVLTWGETPSDLDAHLTGPDSVNAANRFHCYYSSKNPIGSGVRLDVDDVTSYGPETVTIYNFRNGTYRYSVHNYSNQGTNGSNGIASSPAKVEVYDQSGLLKRYSAPPATTGNTWRVFEIIVNGTSKTINDINTYVTASSSGDTGTFGNVKNKIKFSKYDF